MSGCFGRHDDDSPLIDDCFEEKTMRSWDCIACIAFWAFAGSGVLFWCIGDGA